MKQIINNVAGGVITAIIIAAMAWLWAGGTEILTNIDKIDDIDDRLNRIEIDIPAIDLNVQRLLKYNEEAGAYSIDSYSGSWIQGHLTSDKEMLSADLVVNKGDVVEVSLGGSARGQFYYSIVEKTGKAKPKGTSNRILMRNELWTTINTSSLFQSSDSGKLDFRARLTKGDVSGKHTIYNLTLIAKVVSRSKLH